MKEFQVSSVSKRILCWWIKRKDGKVMGFTESDSDVEVDGMVYRSISGFEASALSRKEGLALDHMDIEGVVSHEDMSEQDILAGLYDHAEIRVYQLDQATNTPELVLQKRGWIGEVVLRDGAFVATLHGLSHQMHQMVGSTYSPTCRAELGDQRCGVKLSDYAYRGTVTKGGDVRRFSDANCTKPAGYFTYGRLTWLSGAHKNRCCEISFNAGGVFELLLPMDDNIQKGDRFEVVAGCDKQLKCCKERFHNILHFRGEPHVPGVKQMLP